MPEGHVVHRQARTFTDDVAGTALEVTSPQGRFAEGAALLDGWVFTSAQVQGKHLFLGFAPGADSPREQWRWLHVHLGLYGKWWWHRAVLGTGTGADAAEGAAALDAAEDLDLWEPEGLRKTARVRLRAPGWCAELTGPTRCEVLTAAEVEAVRRRLGPDPLRADHAEAGAKRFSDAVRSRRVAVGQLLMDQSVVAGVGNIYRAEVLFRARQDPFAPGVEVSSRTAHAMWRDLVVLMADGVDKGAIITTEPGDRPHGVDVGPITPAAERSTPFEADQRFYVYKRTGRPCLRCGATILDEDMAGRRLYWCPRCQKPRRR